MCWDPMGPFGTWGTLWDRVQIYKSFLPSISHFPKVDTMEDPKFGGHQVRVYSTAAKAPRCRILHLSMLGASWATGSAILGDASTTWQDSILIALAGRKGGKKLDKLRRESSR